MRLDTLELLLGLVTIESLHLPHREQRVRYVPIWDKGVCTWDTSAWYFNATLRPDDWGPPTAGQNRPSHGLSEASLKAYENMNEFLSAFIERVSHLNVCSLADRHTLDSSYCPSILWTSNMRLLKAVHLAAFGSSMHPCKLQALWSHKPRRIKKHCIFSHCSIPILYLEAVNCYFSASFTEHSWTGLRGERQAVSGEGVRNGVLWCHGQIPLLQW